MLRNVCTLSMITAIAAIAITGIFCVPFGVSAQPLSVPGTGPQCDQRDRVLRLLQQKYKESPVAIGLTHNGGLVEVLSTDDGATWSIIVTTPQRMSCFLAAGERWQALAVAPTPDPGA